MTRLARPGLNARFARADDRPCGGLCRILERTAPEARAPRQCWNAFPANRTKRAELRGVSSYWIVAGDKLRPAALSLHRDWRRVLVLWHPANGPMAISPPSRSPSHSPLARMVAISAAFGPKYCPYGAQTSS